MTEFYETRMGVRFFEHPLPELVRQVTRLADAVGAWPTRACGPANTSNSRRRTTMTPKAETKTRNRRSPDQIVADLEQEIARVRARQAARQAKSTDEGKALIPGCPRDREGRPRRDRGQQRRPGEGAGSGPGRAGTGDRQPGPALACSGEARRAEEEGRGGVESVTRTTRTPAAGCPVSGVPSRREEAMARE